VDASVETIGPLEAVSDPLFFVRDATRHPPLPEDVSQTSDAAIEGKREGMRREKSSTLLGTAEVAESVEVLWPDGATNSGANVPAGFHRIVRP
jgi:hypothetical protein